MPFLWRASSCVQHIGFSRFFPCTVSIPRDCHQLLQVRHFKQFKHMTVTFANISVRMWAHALLCMRERAFTCVRVSMRAWVRAGLENIHALIWASAQLTLASFYKHTSTNKLAIVRSHDCVAMREAQNEFYEEFGKTGGQIAFRVRCAGATTQCFLRASQTKHNWHWWHAGGY